MKAMNVLWLMIMFNVVSIIFNVVGIWTGMMASGSLGSFFISSTLAITLTAGTTVITGFVLGPEYTSAVMFYGFFTGLWNVNVVLINTWLGETGLGLIFPVILFGIGQMFGIIGANQVMSGGWQSHV